MSDRDLIVIGGGEAGISAALRGAELGARVTLVNKQAELGGGCVQTGTLPSKTLRAAAAFLEDLKKAKRYGISVGEGAKANFKSILESRRKTAMCEVGVLATLIRKNKIEVVTGEASFRGPRSVAVTAPDNSVRELESSRVIIASGARPVSVPGLDFNGRTILAPDDMPSLEDVPGRLLIVGAGVVGCEMAFIFRTLGSEVILVEKLERVLAGQDRDVAAIISREFKKRGILFLPKQSLERIEDVGGSRLRAVLSGGEAIEVDRILVAVGRRPNTESLNLPAAGVATGSRGEVAVNEHLQTSSPGIYAAGDVLARFMLSSLAVREARVASENAMGIPSRMDYACAPWGIYTDPEIGSVGLTEEAAAGKGVPVIVGECGYNDLVRSCLEGEVTGKFKLIFEASSGRLIGAHIIGREAAEIIHFAALAIKTAARAEDLKNLVFNHPTFSEGLAKAALDALRKSG